MNQMLLKALFLFCIFQTFSSQAVNLTCTPEIVESYGIIANDQAKKERLVFCPQIAYSCCPAYEQFKMFRTYSEKVKPSLILLNELIKKEIDLLEKEVGALFKGGIIEQKIAQIADEPLKKRVSYVFGKIKNKKVSSIFEKLKKYQKKSSAYVAAWESAFFCVICDFANQEFIDVDKKKITFSSSSCDALTQHTILYVNILNSVLIPLLSSLTEVMTRITKSSKYQKLHGFRKVLKAISDCVTDYKMYDSGLGGCRNYCELFNIAEDNYIFQGYPELFANTLVEIRRFVGGSSDGGAAAAPSAAPRRLIENSVKNLIRRTKAQNRKLLDESDKSTYFRPQMPKGVKNMRIGRKRILEEEVKADIEMKNIEKLEQAHVKLHKGRVLQEQRDWSNDALDPNNNVTMFIDIFDPESSDPNFDEAMMNQLVMVQEIFNSGDPRQFAQLLRKFMAESYEAPLDDINSDVLFKQTTLIRTDISQYETAFSFAGIDIDEVVSKMDWSLAFKQVSMSLTSTSKVDSELILPDVIQALNSVGNSDVREFFRNQYIRFVHQQSKTFNETVSDAIHDLAVTKLKTIIAQNMAVYNYLVQHLQQNQADVIWRQVLMMKQQVVDIDDPKSNITVRLFNHTLSSGIIVEGMNITSSPNASGYANVTFIPDVTVLVNSGYRTSVELVNYHTNQQYLLRNKKETNSTAPVARKLDLKTQKKQKLVEKNVKKDKQRKLKAKKSEKSRNRKLYQKKSGSNKQRKMKK